jgi:hypothetical protein
MAYSRYAIQGRRAMSSETTIVVGGVLGILVAFGALALDISPWRLFGVGCVPAAVVVGLAVWEVSTPCGESHDTRALGVLFLIALGSSLVLYAATAAGGVIDGVRSGGRSAANAVLCPLASFVCGAIVLYAAFGAVFHCFEF